MEPRLIIICIGMSLFIVLLILACYVDKIINFLCKKDEL